MQNIKLFNTLNKKKDTFTPINFGKVNMYSCGPTVYNYMHIGNLRAYVFTDILRRVLEYGGFKVRQIMNVTDIGHLTSDADSGDDKMVRALRREGKPLTLSGLHELSRFYFEKFKEDFQKLNIEFPTKFVFASEHIKEEVLFVQKLLNKGFAYKISDGIYFDISKFPKYGVLGGISDKTESRVLENPEKKNQRDFALWKFSKDEKIGFDSPLGRGYPGWHIECSAMAMKYLGETFDIHTGGIDHISVHHNNEIAQSESLTGKQYVNYWLHNEHLTIRDNKMAKSEDNFLTLKSLENQGVSPLVYRYWLLTSRYGTRIDFSIEAVKSAQSAYDRLLNFIVSSKTFWKGKIVQSYLDRFIEAINDDLDTPSALALVWQLIGDNAIIPKDKKATILEFDKVLGLRLAKARKLSFTTPNNIKQLLNERKIAKDNKDWKKSDEIRKQIEECGYSITDLKDGKQNLTKL